MRLTGLAVIAILVSACAGPVRTISNLSAAGGGQVYPLTADQANAVLLKAMLTAFPDSEVERAQVPAPAVRYQARIRFALDSHIIVATAFPTVGLKDGSKAIDGYVFQVSDSGSMPISGANRAEQLSSTLHTELASYGSPLPQNAARK
ncbi:hypothetical protein GAY33_10730 [Azospirillum brasilense]|uniref:hypothetical protein n=1 Tax=Azospirillum argentinense TaxID=2970906 RepID=UPI00190AF2EC|nr:hypothetical protein [Azospirillum argentinense]MBK3799700.1 hypothetical protein [Azospirillum argentinense]